MRLFSTRNLIAAATVLVGWLYFAYFTPIPTVPLRASMVLSAALLLGITLAVTQRNYRLGVLAVSSILGVAIVLWPLRSIDKPSLRSAYTHSLTSYLKTPYVWGGENARGIDCSGLVRRAWRDALWSEGLHQHNPALWREALLQWWFDASAHDLKEGYRNQLVPSGEFATLEQADTRSMAAGDLAVTANGQHVLAYVGHGRWIQAAPNLATGNEVIVCDATSNNPWLKMPVVMRRWRMLE